MSESGSCAVCDVEFDSSHNAAEKLTGVCEKCKRSV